MDPPVARVSAARTTPSYNHFLVNSFRLKEKGIVPTALRDTPHRHPSFLTLKMIPQMVVPVFMVLTGVLMAELSARALLRMHMSKLKPP